MEELLAYEEVFNLAMSPKGPTLLARLSPPCEEPNKNPRRSEFDRGPGTCGASIRMKFQNQVGLTTRTSASNE